MPVLAATTSNDLSNLGIVFTQVTSWLSSIVSTITASPVLLVGLGIFVTGAVIGLAIVSFVVETFRKARQRVWRAFSF